MPSVCFHVSGHGFGHASRQIEIINTLGRRLPPEYAIHIRTRAARWLFDRTLRVPATLSPFEADTGVVQRDSLRLDEDETARAAGQFYSRFADRVAAEAARLAEMDARFVVADAPPLACAAAFHAGIPAAVLSNFTWDWIYEGYGEAFEAHAPHAIPIIREAYSRAQAGWRLPMHGGFVTIDPIHDLPYVARHATRAREEVLGALRLPDDRPLALSSFGGYGVEGFDPAALDCRESWTVVLTGRDDPGRLPAGVSFVQESHIYDAGLRYEDLLAAMDVVVTKPGYGIISECIANQTAMLYTSRGRFVEYDVMIQEMPKVLRCAYVDQETLLAGRWRESLDRLMASAAPPDAPRTDGAEVAAGWILDRLGVDSAGT